MRRLLNCICAAVLSLSLLLAPLQLQAQVSPTAEGDYLPGEVLVYLQSPAELGAVAAAYGLDATPIDQFGTRPIYRLRISSGADPEAVAEAMEGDLRVRLAEPNFLGQTPESRRKTSWAGGDPGAYVEQWAPERIGLPAAHGRTNGAGVTVAVLDTGVELAHPALAGRLRPGFDYVDMDADPSEGAPTGLSYGHGTHVAGLVALAAPGAAILPVRVLDAEGVGNVWVLSEGLAFAVDPDGNPATDDGARVINLSLGTLRRTELLEQLVAEATCGSDDDDNDAIDSADDDDDDASDDDDDAIHADSDDETLCRGNGSVVVAAAGNDGATTPLYPAAEGVAGLLAIGASGRNDTLAAFSNRGPWVDLSAPGEAISSSVPGGGYGVWSGTSMAAPLSAGIAALLLAVEPGLDPATAAGRLIGSAPRLCSGELPRLDAAAALALGSSPPRCSVALPRISTP